MKLNIHTNSSNNNQRIKYLSILGIFLLFLTVINPNLSLVNASDSKHVWIYYDEFGDNKDVSKANADAMKSKIQKLGYIVELSSSSFDYGSNSKDKNIDFDLVIMDTYARTFENTPSQFNAIDKTVPIIGMGFAGLNIFTKMGLQTSDRASCGNIGTIEFLINSHPIFTTPNQLEDPFSIYEEDLGWDCVHSGTLGDDAPNVEFFAGSTTDTSRVPLSFEKDQYFFWGFDEPLKWNNLGEKLFANVLEFLIGPAILESSTTTILESSTTEDVTNEGDSFLTFNIFNMLATIFVTAIILNRKL